MSNGNIRRGDIHIKRSGVYSSIICMYEYRHIFEFLIFLYLIYFSSLLRSSLSNCEGINTKYFSLI